ncbi:unnamed protein product, partial [marine sediment metagenome]
MVVEFHGSITKRNVVLYGDEIDENVIHQVMDDFELNATPPDLLIVMGTSLQVAPFCAIPNLVRSNCPRVLIDINPVSVYTNPFSRNYHKSGDMFYGGSVGSSSFVCFHKWGQKRRVTLRPQWGGRGKYKTQYI